METFASLFLTILGIYLLVGMAFAVPFAFLATKKIDPAAVGGTWGFKLLIIPGCAIFWPLMLKRWLQKSPPPEEFSKHREAANN